MLDKILIKLAHSRLGVPVKNLVRKLRETYYNAEVLKRPVSKTAPLGICIDSKAPRRVNLLIPEINFARFYGGYIAKFHLARKLVEAGWKVRVITVDQCLYDINGWKQEIAAYEGLENIFDQIEVQCCFDRKTRVVASPGDTVIATTWWTAYIAHEFSRKLGLPEFVYLIQEYEPFTFPMGSYYALANASYDFPHKAFYSTELLQEYFEQNHIGYLHGDKAAETPDYEYFENAIISYPDKTVPESANRTPRKLLFYARPEAHAARNMFEVGYLALSRAIEQGVFAEGEWEFHGIGSSHGDIPLPGGHALKMLGKFGLREYKSRLLEYDLGLALMYTPHPSLLPMEMASAGLVVVTNTCMNKTRNKMQKISGNLLAAEPTVDGVVTELQNAAKLVPDTSQRAHGSQVNWAVDWEHALDKKRMQLLNGWLKLSQEIAEPVDAGTVA